MSKNPKKRNLKSNEDDDHVIHSKAMKQSKKDSGGGGGGIAQKHPQDQDENEEDIEDDEVETDSDLDEEMDKEIGTNIAVEFVAYDPGEADFHGIKCLLQQLWLKEHIDVSELARLIMQNTISTVLKQAPESLENDDNDDDDDDDDEENVYGVISLIPFNSHFDQKQCIQQIKQVLLSYLPEDSEISKKLCDPQSKCALIINERFVNLPPKISIPCYKQMLQELNNYHEENPTDDKYEFDHVIMIAKLSKYRNECIYSNAEDEIFSERSDACYEYSVANQTDYCSKDWNDDDELFEPCRKIMLLKQAKWIRTINVLKDVV